MTAKHDAIKTMKLYHHLDRIERRLRAASPTNSANSTNSTTSTNNLLDPELLGTLDGLHFFGDEPIRRVQQLIRDQQDHQLANNLPTPPRVLDVGTGFGGSARLLAHRTQCVVDALELQPDLSDVAAQLTARCGLTHCVHHVTGDFLHVQLPETNYNVVVGLLCFLHIGHWQELFAKCLRSLAPGGVLYVEDFFRRDASQPFTDHDASILANDVFCQELLTRDELVHVLEDVGFDTIQLVDVTDKWTPFVQARADAFDADIAKHVQLDGADAAHALQHFYRSVATVFSHGRLGGYTLCARRPSTDSP